MGRYLVLEDFRREVNGSAVKHKRGQVVTIDRREEAEAGLTSGALTRNLDALAGNTGSPDKKRPSRWTPEQQAVIDELANETPLDRQGLSTRLRSAVKEGADFDEAVYAIRDRFFLVPEEERIARYADERGDNPAELQAEIYEIGETYGMKVHEVVRWHRLAWRLNAEPLEVVERVLTLRESGKTANEAERIIADTMKDTIVPPEASAAERDGSLVEGETRVRITGGKMKGKSGTVLSVSDGGEVRVVVDDDDAEFRRLDRSQVEIVEGA